MNKYGEDFDECGDYAYNSWPGYAGFSRRCEPIVNHNMSAMTCTLAEFGCKTV